MGNSMQLHPEFDELIRPLPQLLEDLRGMTPVKVGQLPPTPYMKVSGVYWLSEGDSSIYVGSSGCIRQRIKQHAQRSSNHNAASFAFLMARVTTGFTAASYSRQGSREDLLLRPEFRAAFEDAKKKILQMEIRFVEEPHPVRQCLLEVYAATALKASFNDFKTH
jgi:hypothetical protein